MSQATRVCKTCSCELPLTEFYPNYSRPNTYKIHCKSCWYAKYKKGRETLDGVFLSMVKNARARSRQTGREFALVKEDIAALYKAQDGKCALTGEPLATTPRKKGTKEVRDSSTIDRIDPSKGYVKDNIQLVTMQANMAKNQWTTAQLVEFCKNVLRTVEKIDV